MSRPRGTGINRAQMTHASGLRIMATGGNEAPQMEEGLAVDRRKYRLFFRTSSFSLQAPQGTSAPTMPDLFTVLAAAIVVVLAVVMLMPAKSLPAGKKYPPIVSPGKGSAGEADKPFVLRMLSHMPVISNFLAFTQPIHMVKDLFEKFGSMFTVNIFGQRLTFMVGRDARCAFYRSRDDVLSQAEVYGFMTPVFGKGVVYDAPPKIRRQQMQFLSNGLRKASLERHIGHIIIECRKFFDQEQFHPGGEGWGTMDLREVLSELIIVTSSRALMGNEVRETLHNQVFISHSHSLFNWDNITGRLHLSIMTLTQESRHSPSSLPTCRAPAIGNETRLAKQ